jgi:hypothetical protein
MFQEMQSLSIRSAPLLLSTVNPNTLRAVAGPQRYADSARRVLGFTFGSDFIGLHERLCVGKLCVFFCPITDQFEKNGQMLLGKFMRQNHRIDT